MGSLDHLVGAGEQRGRHREPERPGGFEIDHEFVLGRRLGREVGGLLALEDAIDVTGRAPVLIGPVLAIGNEAAGFDEVALPIHCG